MSLPINKLACATPPAALVPWLAHKQVLSEKLRDLTGEARLVLLAQQWVNPSWWEKYMLLIQEGKVFCREIGMQSQDKTYWYARTFIPQVCYESYPLLFKRLDKEPLGNLIFYTKAVERVALSTYSIDANCLEYYWLKPYFSSLESSSPLAINKELRSKSPSSRPLPSQGQAQRAPFPHSWGEGKKEEVFWEGKLWVRFSHLLVEQKASFYLIEILLPPLENLV